MSKIVSSLASIVHTLGLLQGDRVHTEGSYDMVASLLKDYGNHPYSFKLGSASGMDGDIPGRIFSYCAGGIVLSVFPDYGCSTSSVSCLTCAEKHNARLFQMGIGIQCRARGFYVSQDSVLVTPAPFHGRQAEARMETVLRVAFPG